MFCFKDKNTAAIAVYHSCFYWANVLGQASVAPAAWLFIAFLDGGYYECFQSARLCDMPKDKCDVFWSSVGTGNGSDPFMDKLMAPLLAGGQGGCVDPKCVCKLPDEKAGYLRARSQIIAWCLLLISISLMLGVMSLGRCLDRFTYIQNVYINRYRDIEEQVFEEQSTAKAKALATSNVAAFFGKPFRTKLDWDEVSVVPLSEFPDYLDAPFMKLRDQHEPYFSPMHEWAKGRHRVERRWREVVPRLDLPKSASYPQMDEKDGTEGAPIADSSEFEELVVQSGLPHKSGVKEA